MNFIGSKTERNLYKTFAGESRARNKYTFYAEKAKCEGFMHIADVFEETAGNEMAHAREVYNRYLERVSNTKNNLIDAALGESEENKVIYKEFEETARDEGFDDVADFYKELQEVEGHHKDRFLSLAKSIKEGKMFKSNREAEWLCLNCGYIYEGKEAPARCPLCRYPRSYYKKLDNEDCK